MTTTLARKTLLTGFLANGAGEVLTKVSRVAVVVVVGRVMEAEAIGLAAAAIAAGDILKALTENGVAQRIIRARDSELADMTATAHRLFWLWCLGLFVTQLALAAGFWAWTGNAVMPMLIAVLSLEYLFMPAGLVQCALAQRAGRMTGVATIASGQIILGNLATAAMVFVAPVPLSLVLPRILTAPFWLVGMRRLHPWTREAGANILPLRPFLRFGGFVLATEVVKTLRLQADKLLIGALLGAEALGIYFFAFNAGLGIATSFSVAFARVIYPYLCTAADKNRAVSDGVVMAICIVSPIVILQAVLAPIYVPLVFGAKWAGIADIVTILCLAAVPTVIWSAAAQWMRAEDRPEVELYVTALLTAALLGMTLLLAPHGIVAIAWGYLIVSTLVQIAASWPVLRLTFATLFGKVATA